MKIKLYFVVLLCIILSSVSCSRREKVAPLTAPKLKPCDLVVAIRITDPVAPYLSEFGTISLWGSEGYKRTQPFPVLEGRQSVVVTDVPPGRYIVQVSYGTIVASQCIILCGSCKDNWKARCVENLFDELKRTAPSDVQTEVEEREWGAGGYYDTQTGKFYPDINDSRWNWSRMFGFSDSLKPSCSFVSPCLNNISFELPKDARR